MSENELIERYLSEEDKKRIATEVFEEQCRTQFSNDAERLFSNAVYFHAWAIVDEHLEKNPKFAGWQERLAESVEKVISELSEYSVFRAPGEYDRKETIGYQELKKAVLVNRSLLDDKVAELADKIDVDDVLQIMASRGMTLRLESEYE